MSRNLEEFVVTSGENTIHLFSDVIRSFSLRWVGDYGKLNLEHDLPYQQLYHLGYFDFREQWDKIGVFAVPVNELTERSSKKRQFDFARRIILQSDYFNSGAIFLFYDQQGNKRLSFFDVQIDPRNRLKFSSFRRFTFFISPQISNKTFLLQMSDVSWNSRADILEAFSTEPVTRQFYNELANWFFHASSLVHFPNNHLPDNASPASVERENQQHLIRLITRLIFIWFLKQKKLVPNELFDPTSLRSILKDFNPNAPNSHSYYNAILQNLFFATLNQPVNQRQFASNSNFTQNKKTFGIKNFFRYEELFSIPTDKVLELFRPIPFINGGLFDCLDNDQIYIEGFSRNPAKRARIPDYLFFHSDEIKADLSRYGLGTRPVRGLIDIFNSYNFVTDENTAIDQEIALDPEMLGKVFENLLAAYVPETADIVLKEMKHASTRQTERKKTGSFYTPRPIVEFMVDHSLAEYFHQQLPHLSREDFLKLLSYHDDAPELSHEDKEKIALAIDQLRIIDPACGSGAFPMAILQKLTHTLQRIDPDNTIWKNIQIQKILQQAQQKISQGSSPDELIHEINQNFSRHSSDYGRKLYLIQNTIYGIDIQPIATQISKLRFFITLLIEQQTNNNPADNYGIQPLPNLETHFIAADFLIKVKSDNNLFNTPTIQQLKDQIKQIRQQYLTVHTRSEKLLLQQKDHQLRQQLLAELEKLGYDNDDASKIASFDPYNITTHANWSDPLWMFGIPNFHIVIGNPPYVSTKTVDNKTKEKLVEHYQFADDLYSHFYFRGIELLIDNGILAYITSKTFWTIMTKKNVRELLLKNTILLLFDTANPFESAVVDTSVILVKKSPPTTNHQIIFLDGKENYEHPVVYQISQQTFIDTPNQVFFIPTPYNMKIYNKLIPTVKQLLNKWWDKISTSKNIEKNKYELEAYRKNLKPGDITLLGLITEGGVGIQTGNNGKFIGVLEGTKWAEKIKKERPEKLLFAKAFCEKEGIKNKYDAQKFLEQRTEKEIRDLFDKLKEEYGRDVFGQGWLYRIVSKDEIADVNTLTEDEKLNGIQGEKTFVPYDKGDKDGNRWYAPTPYYIDWSRENVKFLKENSGKKGEGMPVVRNLQFYFREGFCWNNVTGTEIICRIKEKSVHSTEAMTFFSVCPYTSDKYLVCLMNSKLFGFYKNMLLNVTVHLTTGDAKEFPIIIPTSEQLKQFEDIFDRAYSIQKQKFEGVISESEAMEKLMEVQKVLDEMVEEMYLGG